MIGYEFTERLLGLIAGLRARELRAALRALVAAELVVERPGTPDRRYAFRHHLIEELAYRSELADRRARIHGAVASALERLYPDRRDELAGLIAHHLEEAAEESLATRWQARETASAEPAAQHAVACGQAVVERLDRVGRCERARRG